MTGNLYKMFHDLGMGGWATIVVVLSLVVDLTPGIKFNPITFIVKKIGAAFNSSIDKKIDEFSVEINEKIDEIDNEIDALQKENKKQFSMLEEQRKAIDMAELNRLKKEILNFSNRISRKQVFTAEEYRTIMDYHTRYEEIIDKYDELSNGKIDVEYESIVKHYQEHKDDGQYMF